jgi:hypothetical protein
MANITITQLPSAGTLTGNESVPVVQNGVTVQTTTGTISNFSRGSGGTVTSVAATVPLFLSVSGSPITTNGTLAFGYSGTALPVANGGTGITTTPAAGAVPYGNGTTYALLAAGTSGQVLTSRGTGAPIWSTISGTGTVTSVGLSAPSLFSVSNSPVTGSGTLTLNYATGQTLPVTQGGTGTATPSLTAGTNVSISGTWPNQTINATGGSGTVTSVAATVPSFLSVSGSPVTTSGTLAFGYSGTALPVANGGTGLTSLTAGYIPYGNGTSAFSSDTNFNYNTSTTTLTAPMVSTSATTSTTPNLSFNASNSSITSGATVSGSYLQTVLQNKSGTAAASTNYVLSNDLGTDSTYYGEFGMNSSVYSGASVPSDFFSLNNGLYFSGHDGDVSIGSGNGKKLYLAWGSSGQSAHVINASGAIGLNTNLAAGTGSGTTNFGTAGQVLTSAGNSATPTWTTVSSTGTVTSVAATVPSFLSVSGSPVTTSGTLAFGYSGTALPVANGGTGITTTPAAGAVPYGNGTTYALLAAGTSGQVLTSGGTGAPTWSSAGTGTVTSVSFTGGIISVATATTTPAFTIAGTSGGIPYFSNGTTWASSAALAASALVIGGGAGAAPSTTTTGTGVITALGNAVNTAAGGLTTINGTATLTNKWLQPRVLASTANSAAPTLNTDNYDMMVITGQTVAITSFTTNLTGTPVNGQKLWISVTSTSNITAWGASFESSGTVTLPTTLTSGVRTDVGFVWNVATSAWRCIALA